MNSDEILSPFMLLTIFLSVEEDIFSHITFCRLESKELHGILEWERLSKMGTGAFLLYIYIYIICISHIYISLFLINTFFNSF